MPSSKIWIALAAAAAAIGAALLLVFSFSGPEEEPYREAILGQTDFRETTDRTSAPEFEPQRETQHTRTTMELPSASTGEVVIQVDNTVRGFVISPDSRRVPHASIVIREVQPALAMMLSQRPGNSWEKRGRCDENGFFELVNVPPGKSYELLAEHQDFAPGTLQIPNVPEKGTTPEFEVTLSEGFRLEGQVLAEAGQIPVQGAQVVVRRSSPMAFYLATSEERSMPGDLEAESDGSGFFQLKNVPEDNIEIVVRAEGFAELRETMAFNPVANPGKLVEKKFLLGRGSKVTGRVQTTDGAPLPEATVVAQLAMQGQFSKILATADENGLFVLDGLREGGEYFLRGQLDGYVAEGQARAKAGEENITVEMTPTGIVTGHAVRSGGGALQRFTASIWTVRDNVPGNRPLQPAQEEGRLTMGTTVEPERPQTPSYPGMEQPVLYTMVAGSEQQISSRDGSFTLSGILNPADYVVMIQAAGLAPSISDRFRCQKGSQVDVGAVRVGAGGKVRGTVIDSAGAPVKGAIVSINCGGSDPEQNPIAHILGPIGPRPLQRQTARTDENGGYSFGGLFASKAANLTVRSNGFTLGTAQDIEIVAEQTTEVPPITLNRGGSVAGMALEDGIGAASGVKVALRADEGSGSLMMREAVTGRDGAFRFDAVPAGRYKIYATGPAKMNPGNPFGPILIMRKTEQKVEVFENQTTEVTLSVPSANALPELPPVQALPPNPNAGKLDPERMKAMREAEKSKLEKIMREKQAETDRRPGNPDASGDAGEASGRTGRGGKGDGDR